MIRTSSLPPNEIDVTLHHRCQPKRLCIANIAASLSRKPSTTVDDSADRNVDSALREHLGHVGHDGEDFGRRARGRGSLSVGAEVGFHREAVVPGFEVRLNVLDQRRDRCARAAVQSEFHSPFAESPRRRQGNLKPSGTRSGATETCAVGVSDPLVTTNAHVTGRVDRSRSGGSSFVSPNVFASHQRVPSERNNGVIGATTAGFIGTGEGPLVIGPISAKSGVCWQTPFTHKSLVHGFPSSQLYGVLLHTPQGQVSTVQGFPSSQQVGQHDVPGGFPQHEYPNGQQMPKFPGQQYCPVGQVRVPQASPGGTQSPVVGVQVYPDGHFGGCAHCPALQTSSVNGFPSLVHSFPSLLGGWVHTPR